jgi:drug/metabolite transporter (DMT)-like permease
VTRRQILTLAALALIWGASFMFIKVAVRELDPAALAWLRIALAAVVLVPLMLVYSGRTAVAEMRRAPVRLTVLGLANTAVPFLLISWAETRIDSGLTAILQAAAPLFTVLIAIRIGDERVTGARLAGVLVGFGGVSLLVGVDRGGAILAGLAVVAAALCYAASSVFSSHVLRDTNPLVIGAGSLAAAALLTAPVGIATLPGSVPGWKVAGSVLALGVVGTGVAYVLYFELLRTAGPSRAILVTYLVPAVAVLYGVLLLDEPLRVAAIVGLALILCGVALAAGGARRAVRREAAAAGAAADRAA